MGGERERAREEERVMRNDTASRVAFLKRMTLPPRRLICTKECQEENGASAQGWRQGRGGVEKGRGGVEKGRGGVEKGERVDGAEGVMRRTLVTFFWCEYTFSRSGPVARCPGGE